MENNENTDAQPFDFYAARANGERRKRGYSELRCREQVRHQVLCPVDRNACDRRNKAGRYREDDRRSRGCYRVEGKNRGKPASSHIFGKYAHDPFRRSRERRWV